MPAAVIRYRVTCLKSLTSVAPAISVATALTASVQKAIGEGYRSRMIDADDLVEVLLAIADRLDPPVNDLVAVGDACPKCGVRAADKLVWDADEETVRCAGCGTVYAPGA
jgi:hypothetical protein